MDANRRKTIIKEIEYWKVNQLLPTQYCDYLLALYTEGDVREQPVKKINSKLLLGMIPFVLFFTSLFVIYFTELSFILQIAFLLFVFLILIFSPYYYAQITLLNHITYFMAAITFLIGSVEVTEKIFFKQQEMLYVTVFVNCFLWMLVGKWKNLPYFILSGFIGVGLLLFFILT